MEPGWGSWSSGDKSKGASVRGWVWGMEWGGTSQRAAEEHRLIQPELVGRGCIYHPITVTNPSSTT